MGAKQRAGIPQSMLIGPNGRIDLKVDGHIPTKAERAGDGRPIVQDLPSHVDLTAAPSDWDNPPSFQLGGAKPQVPVQNQTGDAASKPPPSNFISQTVPLDLTDSDIDNARETDIKESVQAVNPPTTPVTFYIGGPLTLQYALVRINQDRSGILLGQRLDAGSKFQPNQMPSLKVVVGEGEAAESFQVVSVNLTFELAGWHLLVFPIISSGAPEETNHDQDG